MVRARWVIVGIIPFTAVIAGLAHVFGRGPSSPARDIHVIRHVVVIVQENRSFDSYFGTYPGADGIPMRDGRPAVCIPDPATGGCRRPYHDPGGVRGGGLRSATYARRDIADGRMNGFLASAERARRLCATGVDTGCAPHRADVMGYHDAREIPNYRTYARHFVLQDHMFEASASWSLPAHLFLVSEWSARCRRSGHPESCINALEHPQRRYSPSGPHYAWTDLTYLLHCGHVSWGYYVQKGTEPDCRNDGAVCAPHRQDAATPGIWNPLPRFDTVRDDRQLRNIRDLSSFFTPSSGIHVGSATGIRPHTSVIKLSSD